MDPRPESLDRELPPAKDLRLDSESPSVDFHPRDGETSPKPPVSPEDRLEGPDEAAAASEKPFILSTEEKANLSLVILIRFLVMSQPVCGLAGAGLALLLFFATDRASLLLPVAVCVPVSLYLFSVFEVSRVSRYITRNRAFALLYNAANKLLYCGLLLALYQVRMSPGNKAWVLASGLVLCLQLLFFVASLIYKKKQQIDQYVGAVD